MNSVLLIEDNEEIMENTSELLELAGIKIFSTANGDEGIEIAKQHIPGVILCDISMPGKNGYEILRELKMDPLTAEIPFIFFTAHSEKSDIRKGFEMGAVDYLCKPFDEEDLFRSIEKYF